MAADVSNAQSNIKTNDLRVQTISESKIFACGAFFVMVLLSALGGNIITFTAQYQLTSKRLNDFNQSINAGFRICINQCALLKLVSNSVSVCSKMRTNNGLGGAKMGWCTHH